MGGQAVLNYRVLRELGSRVGPVYAAHRVVGGRMELAVLQHFKRPRDAASQLSGILRDARAVAEVAHPNLMRVHNAEPVGEEIVVASDYIEGEALSGLRGLARAQKTPFVLEVQLRIVMEVLAGLHALHGTKDARRRQIGLYHGLLTPVDILVGLDGIVRVVGIFHTLPIRIPQELVPFSNYLAPEVRLGDRGIDRRADVYGAGALLWEALVGKAPFDDVPG